MKKYYQLEASCYSYLGEGRSSNEDNFYFNKKRLVKKNRGMNKSISSVEVLEKPVAFAVFDGIGGASYGEEASYIASKIFSESIKELDDVVVSEKEFLFNICKKSNYAVNMFATQKQISQMGTTIAALLFEEEEVHVCNVGDSRAFLFRDDKLIQISKDHTDEDFLKSIGVEKKPSLLQYIGMASEEGELDPFISKGRIRENDIYVLCSDGVTDCINVKELYETIKCQDNPEKIVTCIINMVKESIGQDNATIIVIKII